MNKYALHSKVAGGPLPLFRNLSLQTARIAAIARHFIGTSNSDEEIIDEDTMETVVSRSEIERLSGLSFKRETGE